MNSWFDTLDLSSLQEQISRSVEEATEILNTVQRLDLLNLDEMATEQLEEELKAKNQNLIDSPLQESTVESTMKELSMVEDDHFKVCAIPSTILHDHIDDPFVEFDVERSILPYDELLMDQSSDTLFGFLAPMVSDTDNVEESLDQRANEHKLPKRVVTNVMANSFSFFENLDDDELVVDPILKRVEQNRINFQSRRVVPNNIHLEVGQRPEKEIDSFRLLLLNYIVMNFNEYRSTTNSLTYSPIIYWIAHFFIAIYYLIRTLLQLTLVSFMYIYTKDVVRTSWVTRVMSRLQFKL